MRDVLELFVGLKSLKTIVSCQTKSRFCQFLTAETNQCFYLGHSATTT